LEAFTSPSAEIRLRVAPGLLPDLLANHLYEHSGHFVTGTNRDLTATVSPGTNNLFPGLQNRHNLLAGCTRHRAAGVQLRDLPDQPDINTRDMVDPLDDEVDAVDSAVNHRDDCVNRRLDTAGDAIPQAVEEIPDAVPDLLHLVDAPLPSTSDLVANPLSRRGDTVGDGLPQVFQPTHFRADRCDDTDNRRDQSDDLTQRGHVHHQVQSLLGNRPRLSGSRDSRSHTTDRSHRIVIDLHRRASGDDEPSQTDDSHAQAFDRLGVPLNPRNHSAVNETHGCRERWQQSITGLLFRVVYL